MSRIVRQILRNQDLAESEENIANFLALYAEGLARELPRRTGRILPGIEQLLPRLQENPAERARAAHRQHRTRRETETGALRALAFLRVRRLCR